VLYFTAKFATNFTIFSDKLEPLQDKLEQL